MRSANGRSPMTMPTARLATKASAKPATTRRSVGPRWNQKSPTTMSCARRRATAVGGGSKVGGKNAATTVQSPRRLPTDSTHAPASRRVIAGSAENGHECFVGNLGDLAQPDRLAHGLHRARRHRIVPLGGKERRYSLAGQIDLRPGLQAQEPVTGWKSRSKSRPPRAATIWIPR